MVICLERGAMQTCIWPGWCHCHSLSLASVKSRLVLPFWYRLTRVVLDKGPLNGCACVCVCSGQADRQTDRHRSSQAWSRSSLFLCRSWGSSPMSLDRYSMPPSIRTVAALRSMDGGTLRPDRSSMAAGRLFPISWLYRETHPQY